MSNRKEKSLRGCFILELKLLIYCIYELLCFVYALLHLIYATMANNVDVLKQSYIFQYIDLEM